MESVLLRKGSNQVNAAANLIFFQTLRMNLGRRSAIDIYQVVFWFLSGFSTQVHAVDFGLSYNDFGEGSAAEQTSDVFHTRDDVLVSGKHSINTDNTAGAIQANLCTTYERYFPTPIRLVRQPSVLFNVTDLTAGTLAMACSIHFKKVQVSDKEVIELLKIMPDSVESFRTGKPGFGVTGG